LIGHSKRSRRERGGQDRPGVAKARAEWREKQPSLAPGKLVFIDETSTRTRACRQLEQGFVAVW
jgi:hypothetical protein